MHTKRRHCHGAIYVQSEIKRGKTEKLDMYKIRKLIDRQK